MQLVTKVSRRTSVAALLVAVLAVALAGCENFGQGPISVKRDGEHLQIAVCTAVQVSGVYAEFDEPSAHRKDVAFLDGAGKAMTHKGQIFSTGATWTGLNLKSNEDPAMSAGSVLDIVLSTKPKDAGLAGTFNLGSAGLSSTRWTHPDGRTSTTACG
jgi:hypothetical protein